jgi:hypothetical protein
MASDSLFIRLHDGTLGSISNALVRHANDLRFEQNFYKSNGRTPPKIHPDSEYPKDEPGETYTINNEHPATGFIIEHPPEPNHPQQSFAMKVTA